MILRHGDSLDPAIEALRSGGIVIAPTDTGYALLADAQDADACDRISALRGRVAGAPTALVCASVDALLRMALPELLGARARRIRRLSPAPITYLVPNPAHRFAWLCGARPEVIGVRVPLLTSPIADVVAARGAVVAPAATAASGTAAGSLAEVPHALVAAASVVIDHGPVVDASPTALVDCGARSPGVVRGGPYGGRALEDLLVRAEASVIAVVP
jgi:L-threonylcarbamoyladenylate synthase